MATHSSILAWDIPWTEEPGGLQSTGSQRVGHNRATDMRNVGFHAAPSVCPTLCSLSLSRPLPPLLCPQVRGLYPSLLLPCT